MCFFFVLIHGTSTIVQSLLRVNVYFRMTTYIRVQTNRKSQDLTVFIENDLTPFLITCFPDISPALFFLTIYCFPTTPGTNSKGCGTVQYNEQTPDHVASVLDFIHHVLFLFHPVQFSADEEQRHNLLLYYTTLESHCNNGNS